MKKGQIFAQPFIIIFALIVAVLVLVFGFKTVLDIQDKGKFAQLLDAQEDIKEVSRTMYTLGEGSQRTLKLRVPKNIKCFCFFNPSGTTRSPQTICDEDNLDQIINIDPSSYNLYITPLNSFPITKFKIINQLQPSPNTLLCIPIVNSIFEATLTSKGSFVEISA